MRLRVSATEGGSDLVDLLLVEVQTIEVVRDAERTLLRIDMPDDFRGGSLWLRVDADLSVAWQVGEIARP